MRFCATVFVSTVFFFTQQTTASKNFVEDYCWRDYDGIIPLDALKAGIDTKGKPIYIGQVLYEDKLIPAKLHHSEAKIHLEFFKSYTANETIKILCTNHPEKFKWFPMKFYDVDKIKDKHLLEGGYEKGSTTYIGRTSANGETTVGKVTCYTSVCNRLNVVEEEGFRWYEEFEILTYDPNASQVKTDSNRSSFVPYLILVLVTALLLVLLFLLLRHC